MLSIIPSHALMSLANYNDLFNIFTSGLIQAVRAKTAGLHVVLCGNFSSPVSATDPVKSSKDVASLIVSTRKKFFLVGGGDFL